MKKKFLLASIAFVMLAGVTKIASAQTTELETQVVTSSKSQAKVEQMSLYTTIISQDDIKKSTAQTLDQLLKEVPGFNFSSVPSTQTDPTGQSTKLRGVGTARVLVLLDGIPLLDPFYSTTQFFKIQLANVDHVEVVRGGNSSIWGNMAVAGVVNVITKRVKDNSGEVNISYGSFGSNNVSVSKNFTEKKELGFNLTVDQLDSKGYGMTPIDQNYKVPGRGLLNAKDTNIQLTTYFAPRADLNAYLRVGYHMQNQDISYQYGSNLMKSPDVSGVLNKKISDDADISISGWSQLVSLDKNNGAACYYLSAGSCKGGYASSSTVSSTSDVSNTIYQYLRQKDVQQYRETGGSALFSEKIRGKYFKDYQIGFDFRKISGSDYQENYAIKTSLITAVSPTYMSTQVNTSGDQLYAGLFAQTRITPDEKTTVNLSSRIDTYNASTADAVRGYTSSQSTALTFINPSGISTNKASLNPNIGVRREINDQLSIRSAVYKSFRGPGLNQTVRSYGNSIANPELGLETLYGKELGLDWNTEKATLNATYFYYDIKNMITTYKVYPNSNVPTLVSQMCGGDALSNCSTTGGTTFGTNNDDGISKGIELSGKYIFTPELTAGAWYTNTNTFMSWKGTSAINTPLGVQSVAVPKIMAGASMTYKLNEKAQTTLQARYIGKMYTDITTSASTYYEQGANIVYDTNLRYKYSKETDVFMSIANLLNKSYSENDYVVANQYNRTLSPPRVITIGAKVGF